MSKTIIKNIYNGNIGQKIEHVDTIHFHMDGDGQFHFGEVGSTRRLGGYSDEQIARAITAINGSGKPLNTKRRWAGVYWCLRWYCNFPASASEFCQRVKKLPLGSLDYECDYNCIRRDCTLSFMGQDARFIDRAKPSNMDKDFFMQCREVVLALAQELEGEQTPHR